MKQEELEQRKVFDWIAFNKARHKELELAYHIPNEGERTKAAGSKLKRLGMLKGVSDICLPVHNDKYSNLYIELKAGNNRVSQEQLFFIERINEIGGKAVIVYGGDCAIDVIKAYLNNKIDEMDIINNTYPASESRKTKKKYIGKCGEDCRKCDCYNCIGRIK